MKKILLRSALSILVFVVFCVGFLFFAQTSDRGPGDYSAGYQTTRLEVPHRDETLDLFVWYPTQQQGETELLGQNALFYGHHVRKNAAPLSGSHPLIVFSHGSGGNALQTGWLANALAERGYVVLAANHRGTTSRDSLPDRTVMIWERAKDLHAMLDWAEKPDIAGLSLDVDTVAAIGFSLGGHSALAVSGLEVSKTGFIEYCGRNAQMWDCGWLARGGVDFTKIDAARYEANYRDPRVSATVAIDPALAVAATPQSAAKIAHPVMAINFEPNEGIAEALDASEIISIIGNGDYHVIERSWHFSFLPECSLLGKIIIGLAGDDNICSDWQLKNRGEVHRSVIDLVLPFLEKNLPVKG